MNPSFSSSKARKALLLALAAVGCAVLVSGCAGMRGWVSKAGNGPVTGGARVNVPLGH